MKKFIREHPRAMRMVVLAGVVVAVNLLFSACGGSGSVELRKAGAAGETSAAAESGTEMMRNAAGGNAVSEKPANALDELRSASAGEEMTGSNTSSAGEDHANPAAAENTAAESALIYVYVCGAVEKPGVYALGPDARMFEALEAAGGVTKEAMPAAVNQARHLEDGEEIYIPTKEEVSNGTFPAEWSGCVAAGSGSGDAGNRDGSAEQSAAVDASGKVNINTADETELQKIPGVGEARARAIIEYRSANGGFHSIEDLMKVSGIKQAVFERMRDSVTTGTGG